ncbi:L-threonylcarbamoyladenylate synthase [Granulosicoccaceae sp. 1_MG-2023]|nr:L-threonylcarbamoyladenylate synthase [Granulosicoccaceae sp. 1_MG-2023]
MSDSDAISLYSQHAAGHLRRGGILIYPTEGVYGIGCLASDEAAIQRLLQIKHRDPAKGLILIASRIAQIRPWISHIPAARREQILASWPGPVTWVLPAAPGISALLTGGRNTIAIRVSAQPFVRALCDELDAALISTSANRSGEPPATTPAELQQTFGSEVDYIVPLMPGDLQGPTPIFDAQSGKQLR